MSHKRYTLLCTFIFSAGVYAAASSSITPTARPTSELVRRAPYHGKDTPYYTIPQRLAIALRNGDTCTSREMLVTHPDLVFYSFTGDIMPMHVICAMEHFNASYNAKGMLQVFAEQARVVHRDLLRDNADVSNPAFHLLCTGEQLDDHPFGEMRMTPIEIAASYPNYKTLTALVQIFPSSEIVANTIINDSAFDRSADLYKLIICNQKKSHYHQSSWNTFFVGTQMQETIIKILENFGVEGFKMLLDEEVNVFAIHYGDLQQWLSAYEEKHPEQKDAINDLRNTHRPASAWESITSSLMSFAPSWEAVDSLLVSKIRSQLQRSDATSSSEGDASSSSSSEPVQEV